MASNSGSKKQSLFQVQPEIAVSMEDFSVMESGFKIDLIREEICKYLSIAEKRSLRLSSRNIWELTLPTWRKTVAVRIGNNCRGCISWEDFYNLFQQNNAKEGENSPGQNDCYLLDKYPFKNYVLYKWEVCPFPKFWNQWERFFWEKCAPTLTGLTFEKCFFGMPGFIETYCWIVKHTCPLLETLNFINMRRPSEDKWKLDLEKFSMLGSDPTENLDGERLARKLKCLSCLANGFPVYGVARVNEILEVAPNLQVLTCDPQFMEGLPNGTKSLQKLELILSRAFKDNRNYENLVQYTARYPCSIKYLKLNGLRVRPDSNRNRSYIPQLYKMISQCAALSSLEIIIELPDYDCKWYGALMTIDFPVLTKLKISFEDGCETLPVHFDFETLKQTPKLKTLVVRYDPPRKENGILRERKADLWLENAQAYQEINLPHLETFYFDGWTVNSEDLQIFSGWFPDLKQLTVGLDRKTSPELIPELFQSLQMLTLSPQSETHQGKLFNAKMKHGERVRFFQDGGKFGKVEVVEGVGCQGRYVFQPMELKWGGKEYFSGEDDDESD